MRLKKETPNEKEDNMAEPALAIGFERDNEEKELNLEDFDIPSWLSKETVRNYFFSLNKIYYIYNIYRNIYKK